MMSVHKSRHTYAKICMQRLEDHFVESILPVHPYVLHPGDLIQGLGFHSKHLYPLSSDTIFIYFVPVHP